MKTMTKEQLAELLNGSDDLPKKMSTNYNHDIAHCSGYCCLLRDKCRRYHLFREWERRKLPPAPFTGACFDLETKTCPCFLPMPDEEHQKTK